MVLDIPNQPLEQSDARRTSDDLRMHRQHKRLSLRIQLIELRGPVLENRGWRHHYPPGQLNAVQEKGRIIKHPGEGKLDQTRFFAVDNVLVRFITIEKIG